MKTIKPQKLALLTRCYEYQRECFLSVAAIMSFPFDGEKKLFNEVELWKFLPAQLGQDQLDGFMPKARAEYLIKGTAFARGGQPAVACEVAAQVGALRKTLRVVGDRYWKDRIPSVPTPFTELPLTWERAFGGPGYELNPLGKGAAPVELGANKVHVQFLPNIEDPRHLIRAPRDQPAPACFAPIDITWPQRAGRAGTYDQKWLKERFPGFADDLDWSYFNAAPEDQRMEGAFQGDEPFAFDGLHPTKARITGRLPGATARCFVNVKTSEGEAFHEVPLRLDTLWFFPHAERGVLIFHGSTRVIEDDAADVLQIVAACEELGAPRPVEHYRKVLADRLDKETGSYASMRESDLVPNWPNAADTQDPGDMQAIKGEDLLQKNLRRKAEREVEQLRAQVVARGGDPASVPPLPPPPPPPDPEKLLDVRNQALAQVEEQKKEAEVERKRLEALRAQQEDALRRELREKGLDPEPVLDRLRRANGGPPRFSAKEEWTRLQGLVAQLKATGEDASQFEARLAHPATKKRLVAAEAAMRKAYVMSAHEGPLGPVLDAAESARAREALRAALHAGESFEGRDLTGADLSGMKLSGAKLAGAFMEGVKLTGADLSGADLSGTVLARADLTGADLRQARMVGASLGAAQLTDARLDQADLQEAILSKADLTRTGLQGANLEKAMLMEAHFAETDLSTARAPQVVFLKADLSRLKLAGADLSQATFLESTVEGADFSGATLESATFIGARGNGATFRGARMVNLRLVQQCTFEQADFRGADLSGANLRGSKLAGSDFSGARLRGADLSECELRGARLDRVVAREARFVRADCAEASLTDADFMDAVFQKAKVLGADLRRSSFYRADLSRVLSDDRTQQQGTHMKKVRFDPRATPPPTPKEPA